MDGRKMGWNMTAVRSSASLLVSDGFHFCSNTWIEFSSIIRRR